MDGFSAVCTQAIHSRNGPKTEKATYKYEKLNPSSEFEKCHSHFTFLAQIFTMKRSWGHLYMTLCS